MKTFVSEIKSVAQEFTVKEWAVIVAGVLTFVILTGVCG